MHNPNNVKDDFRSESAGTGGMLRTLARRARGEGPLENRSRTNKCDDAQLSEHLIQIASSNDYQERCKGEPDNNLPIRNVAGIIKKKELPTPEPAAVKDILALGESQPNCNQAIQRIAVSIWASVVGNEPVQLPPMLLYGKPGVGKTYFMNQVAALLGLPFYNITLAGSGDSLKLLGSSKGWGNACPGHIATSMAKSAVANPIFLLDEIDKTDSALGKGARMIDTLLLLLESESSRQFVDAYLEFPIDISHASFIATANNIEELPDHLLSRFECIEIMLPTVSEQGKILKNLYKNMRNDRKWGGYFEPELSPNIIELMINQHGLSVREIRNILRLAMEKALLTIQPGTPMKGKITLQPHHIRFPDKPDKVNLGFIN